MPKSVGFTTGDVAGSALDMATELTGTIPHGARGAIITVDDTGDAVRFRDDGTDPTATVGQKLNPGDILIYDSWTVPKQNWRGTLLKCTWIQAAASTTGTLMITWYD
jgi:hypothetical protein